jgi:hypothetical protein
MKDETAVTTGESPRRISSFFAQKRFWLNFLLFVVTVFSTFYVGFFWSINYKYADTLAQEPGIPANPAVILDPGIVGLSLIYAVVLIVILLGHELGHFLTCRFYRIDATLPYFIPAPTIIGTMGAFIRIRSPITRKQQLFDIGIAGPLTGFILALPAVVYGLSVSKAVPALPTEESLQFGYPLIIKLIGSFFFQGIPEGYDLIPHPIAFAGWVGVLVTALNLFPVGQLDGGHIVYALVGPKSRKLAPFILGAFVFMGIFFWIGWFVWALLIYFLGLKHPHIYDESRPLSPFRKFLGILMMLVFILSFIPDPIKGYNLFDLLKQLSLIS